MDEDRKRQDRNEKIVRALERIESRVNALMSKTERFKVLRRQYQSYLERISPAPKTISSRQNETFETQETLYENPTTLKAFKNSDEEKMAVLDKYLQNLGTKKFESTTTTSHNDELETLDELSRKLSSNFDSNKANSIAEDIMNSIYNRHYKKEVNNVPRTLHTRSQESNVSDNESKTEQNYFKTRAMQDKPYYNENNYSRENTEEKKHSVLQHLLGKENKEQNLKKPEYVDRSFSNYKPSDGERNVSKTKPYSPIVLSNTKKPDPKIETSLNANNQYNVKNIDLAYQSEFQKLESQLGDNNSISIPKVTNFERNSALELNKKDELSENENSFANIQDNFDIPISQQIITNNSQQSPEHHVTEPHYINETELEEKEILDKTDCVDKKLVEDQQPKEYILDETTSLEKDNLNKKLEQHNHEEKLNINSPIEKTEEYQQKINEVVTVENSQPVTKTSTHEDDSCKDVTDHNPLQGNEQQEPVNISSTEVDEGQKLDQPSQNIETHDHLQSLEQTDVQYDNNYETSHEYGHEYDENGQPIQQYDENGQPLYSYDVNGQLIQSYEGNGHSYHTGYDENGQPIGGNYDENGQPILQQHYDENGQPIFQQHYDENGQPILQQNYDETGQPILHQNYDEHGQPIYHQQFDEHGQVLLQQQYDENGLPTNQQYVEHDQASFHQQYDEHGQPVFPQYDEQGQPIGHQQYETDKTQNEQYDQFGQPIIHYDEHGQHIPQEYDSAGQPIITNPQYHENAQYDENGQPIPQYDENGQFMVQHQFDVQYDENGQPISHPQAYEDQPHFHDNTNQELDGNQQLDGSEDPVQPSADELSIQGSSECKENLKADDVTNIPKNSDAFGETVVNENDNSNLPDPKQEIPAADIKKSNNVLDLLDTDTESVKQNTSKISNDSDFDFSNG